MAAAKKKKQADEAEILALLSAAMRGEIPEDCVAARTIEKGESFERPMGPRERMRAAELLGKHYNLFESARAKSTSEGVEIIFEDIWEERED